MIRALTLFLTIMLTGVAGAEEVKVADPYPDECTVFFTSYVTMETMGALMTSLKVADQACEGQVLLIIESGGGSVEAGQFYLRDLEAMNLHTHVRGQAGSMAVLIYLTGTTRTMAPNSSLFLHNMSYTFSEGETLDAEELQAQALALSTDDHDYADYVASRIGLDQLDVLITMGQDTTMPAETAISLDYAQQLADY